MKKEIVYIIIMLLSILFMGCENSNSNTISDASIIEKEKIEYEDIEFNELRHATETTEAQPLNQMKKIYCDFIEGDVAEFGEMIAIDIERRELYVNCYYKQISITEPTYMLSNDEIEEFLNIIETYKIQEWEHEYVIEGDENSDDSYCSWAMYMQNGDNTVEKHWGATYKSLSQIKPPNYDEFKAAMIEFVNNCDIGFSRIPTVEKIREKRSLKQAKKVVFNFLQEDIDGQEEIIAIDIENKELYVDYEITQIDYEEPTCMLEDNDIEELLDIIKKYEIQEWDYEYCFEEENNMQYRAWIIYIENQDRTVEKHIGITNTFNCEGVKPTNYDEFKTAIIEFTNKCIEKGYSQ